MAAAAEDSDQVRLEDRPRLVLTEATLLEVARLGSVLPIAPPRQCPVEVQVGAASSCRSHLVLCSAPSVSQSVWLT